MVLYFIYLFLLVRFLKVVYGVSDGPCTLGVPPTGPHPRGTRLICATNGYFELIQCISNYCICVDPATGFPSLNTKTNSKKITPHCGKCHVQLSEYYKTSAHNPKIWRPICDYKFGNYQPKQCKAGDEHCFCVDKMTGERLTEKDVPNALLDCNTDKKATKPTFPSVLQKGVPAPEKAEVPIGDESCKLPMEKGNICTGGGQVKAKTVKWHFDANSFECLAFGYNGCGGNENLFDSPSECWSKCKLADLAGCPGMTMPYRNSRGEMEMCGNKPGVTKDTCPTGYACTMLPFFGVCCHKETQDLYNRNYRPTCSNGKSPHQIDSASVRMTLIGKNCKDEFCPSGTTCHQLEIFAHCCPN